jgi:hypothetical protein
MLPTQQQKNLKHFTIFAKNFDEWVKFYRPLSIEQEFSKKSGMIVYCCRTFCKNFKFFNVTGKYFVLIQ